MIRAGLDAEPDLRPGSLVVWRGVMVLEETGKTEAVARRLGIRSPRGGWQLASSPGATWSVLEC